MTSEAVEPERARLLPAGRAARRLSNVVVALVPLVVGAGAAVLAYNLRLGTLTVPGAGMWPFLVSVLVVVSALAVMAGEGKTADHHFGAESLRIVVVLASLAAFIVIFMSLGFTLAAFVSLTFWLRYIGHESWRLSLVTAFTATAVFQVLFVELLRVPFPTDVITRLWGG